MTEQSFDVVVIGGGPGGYVTAIRAAQLGMRAALVEREHLGGICLNWGCIPTKALLRSAEIYRHLKEARRFGVKAEQIGFDLVEMVSRSRGVSASLQRGVAHLLKKNRVPVFEGTGRVEGSGRVCVTTDQVQTLLLASHIVIATGARALEMEGLKADGRLVWTYREALVPETLPGRLLIVGAGAIGLEFASFYRELGVEVTVVEALSRVLPSGDEEVSLLLRRELERQGITIHTSTRVTAMFKGADHVTATLEGTGAPGELTVDRVLLAMGVVGNVEELGLEKTRVQVQRGAIRIDGWMRTDEPGIYAIGDVAGPPCLAHKASREGVLCVEKIAGLPHLRPLERNLIPYCTYTHPQVAGIGLTEKQARERQGPVRVGTFPFAANGKALALGETSGFLKVIFDARTSELLGAHLIGAEVTEMIQGYGIAMGMETTEAELEQTIFAHPTLSEMMHEAVLAAHGRAVHI